MTFEADGKATAETVDAQGNARKTVLMNHNDGKFFPITGITGSNLAYDAAADKVINIQPASDDVGVGTAGFFEADR